MATKRGEQLAPGIWRLDDSKRYVAVVNYTDRSTGRRYRETRTGTRIDVLQQWQNARKTDALRGEIVRKPKHKRLTVNELAEEYLERHSTAFKRPASQLRDRTSLVHLQQAFGKKLLTEITRDNVERYMTRRLKRDGVRPGTVNRELCLLKNMLRKAVEWNKLELNPIWGLKQLREDTPEFTALSFEERDRLLAEAPENVRALLTVAVHTGLRRGELCRLAWDDVNLSEGQAELVVREAKNHEVRHIPLNDVAREALRTQPRRIIRGQLCPLVFSQENGRPIGYLETGFRAALKAAGIERHVRFHDLRHTYASLLVRSGVQIQVVAKLMGHRTLAMTMRYTHFDDDQLRRAVSALTRSPEARSLAQ